MTAEKELKAAKQKFEKANEAYKKENYEKAARTWKQAADQGHIIASNNIGLMYLRGQGIERDYEQAYNYFMKGHKAGYEECTFNLQSMIAQEQGVSYDDEKDYVYSKYGTIKKGNEIYITY